MQDDITIEVAYALPNKQVIIPVKLHEGVTAEEAIVASGVLKQFPEIDLAVNKTGIFGKLIKLDTALRENDRVEIYRPLIADPKEVRRKRAANAKGTKKGGA